MDDGTDAKRQDSAGEGLTASARSIAGSLRQDVLIGSRHRLVTDEPEHLGGDDAGPAPHELLPAALASCVSTTIMMFARTRRWEIGEVRVGVDYDHRSTPPRFRVSVHLDGSLPPEWVSRLEKAAAACPVRRAIESGITFDERIVLDLGPGPDAAPHE